MLVDQSGVCHYGSVPDVLHAAKIRFGHTNCSINIGSIFVALGFADPQDRFLQYLHRNLGVIDPAGRDQIFKSNRLSRIIRDVIDQFIPCACANQKKIGRHGNLISI